MMMEGYGQNTTIPKIRRKYVIFKEKREKD
jgi:hypothetical protein